jgi:hypothetical protein
MRWMTNIAENAIRYLNRRQINNCKDDDCIVVARKLFSVVLLELK